MYKGSEAMSLTVFCPGCPGNVRGKSLSPDTASNRNQSDKWSLSGVSGVISIPYVHARTRSGFYTLYR